MLIYPPHFPDISWVYSSSQPISHIITCRRSIHNFSHYSPLSVIKSSTNNYTVTSITHACFPKNCNTISQSDPQREISDCFISTRTRNTRARVIDPSPLPNPLKSFRGGCGQKGIRGRATGWLLYYTWCPAGGPSIQDDHLLALRGLQLTKPAPPGVRPGVDSNPPGTPLPLSLARKS